MHRNTISDNTGYKKFSDCQYILFGLQFFPALALIKIYCNAKAHSILFDKKFPIICLSFILIRCFN